LNGYLLLGKVFTGRASDDIQEALIVEGNMITFVGTREEALRLVRDKNIKVLDFGDRLITPGMIDAHCHMSVAGLYMRIGIDLSGAISIEEIKEAIKREIRRRGRSQWIYGFGLDESRLKERRLPTRWDLDEVAPENPVVIEHISGHLAVVNSYALKMAGITAETKDPPGGVIDRDESGEPTGVLRDNAMNLVFRLMPPARPEDWVEGLRLAQDLWLRNGFTAVEDLGTFGAWEVIRNAYTTLLSRGELKVRARIAYAISSPEELDRALSEILKQRRADNEKLRSNLLKLFYDGSGLARTALLYDDWCENFKKVEGKRGIRVLEKEVLKEILKKALGKGVRVTIHAIGDLAVDEVLESYLEVSGGRPQEDCELSVVHAILVSDRGKELLKRLNVCVKTQTGFIYTFGHVYASNLCEERARRSFPVRTLLDAGVTVANSTDAPFVGNPNPVEGLYGAVFRRPRALRGDVFGRDEAVSFKEALEMYAYQAARATGWDDVAGLLEPGKRADVVVWSLKSLNPGEEELLLTRPVFVMVDGSVVVQSL
jgi:predicted amidohydrolase YtcJ